MQKTVYKVKKVEVMDFKPKEFISVIKIIYTKNDQQQQIIREFPFINPVDVVNKIILEIKKSDKMIVEDTDDILQNIYITRIEDEENVEEKMLYFFQNLSAKLSKIKSLVSSCSKMSRKITADKTEKRFAPE